MSRAAAYRAATGARERASRFISQAISASESAMPARLIQTLCARLPADTTSTATVSNSSCAVGSGAAACCAWPLGKMRKVNAAYSAMIGSRMPKAQRQACNSAKMPPTAGPTSVAMPHIAEISAMARGHNRCSNTRLIIA